MATKSGGGTTGSGTPWTAQQFSAWKRREKGRLVKLRAALSDHSLSLLSYAVLKTHVDKTEEKVITLTRSIAGLRKKALYPAIPSFRSKEEALERKIRELDLEIASRFFTGTYVREKKEVATRLRQLEKEHATERRRAAASAEKTRDREEPLLKEAQQSSRRLVKVQNAAKDLGLTKSRGPLGEVVDQRLADLDKKPEPPWVVEAVTAYAKERAAEVRKAQKEEADNRKQLEKDSKELAGLQGSEAAISKRIEALERRLERENDRVLAERKFIYTKLLNKRHEGGPGSLTVRERSFIDFDWDDYGANERTWARDPKHKDWATRGVEFSAKLRTSARKIEELEADIKELKAVPKRIRELKSSIRKFEKDIAAADKANAAAGGWPKGKAPRIGYIADAHAFEKYMAEWMRWLGWDDAKAMPVGPDEGIDVKATGALGQAKHWDTEVGIEEVQRHNGVCEGIQKYGRVFLSKSGYTPQAIKWANDRDLPLFEMKAGSKEAGVVASSKAGEKLLKVGAKAMKGSQRK